jgi:hypothetical protein
MTDRAASRLGWVTLCAIVVAVFGGLAFAVATGTVTDLFSVAVLPFPVMGALIASRQPRNAVGWIMLGIGATVGLSALLNTYSHFALAVRPGSLPAPGLALQLNGALWVPVIGLTGTFLLLLFPDGRLPSLRWRAWGWLCAVALIVPFILLLVYPGSFAEQGYPDVKNPLGIDALRPVIDPLLQMVIMLIPICIVGCAVSLIQRFRRSHGQERLQLKWFAAAAGVVAFCYLVCMSLDIPYKLAGQEDPGWVHTLQSISIFPFFLIPVAAGIAIVKYRLYEIDRIINKTLVYGAVTVLLALGYAGLVLGIQAVLPVLARDSAPAVAASTLAMVALFRPLRNRVQSLVDRRFYRRRYDAARTIESFSSRLRQETDLDSTRSELLAVVGDTMQPAHASLWFRPITGRGASGAERL